jgi:hypothetical protein
MRQKSAFIFEAYRPAKSAQLCRTALGGPTSCPGIRLAGSSILATPVSGNQIKSIESREAFRWFAMVNVDVSDRETAGANLVGEGDGAPGNATREIFDAADSSRQPCRTPDA